MKAIIQEYYNIFESLKIEQTEFKGKAKTKSN